LEVRQRIEATLSKVAGFHPKKLENQPQRVVPPLLLKPRR
jgi:hypothetical protein